MNFERIKQFTEKTDTNENVKISFEGDSGITYIELDKLKDFKGHPFHVREEELDELIDSIQSIGLIEPIICRTINTNEYEIISGHRRVQALRKLNWQKAPVKIKELNNDMANLLMVESNLIRREKLLPSELAKALKIKLDTLKKAKISSRLLDLMLEEENIRDKISEEQALSKTAIQRYLRLNYLSSELLEFVDNSVINNKDKMKLSLKSAEQLSYLDKNEQFIVYQVILENEIKKISESQAKAIKIESEENEITPTVILSLLNENKNKVKSSIKFTHNEMEQYFNNINSNEDLKNIIIQALDLLQQKESS